MMVKFHSYSNKFWNSCPESMKIIFCKTFVMGFWAHKFYSIPRRATVGRDNVTMTSPSHFELIFYSIEIKSYGSVPNFKSKSFNMTEL